MVHQFRVIAHLFIRRNLGKLQFHEGRLQKEIEGKAREESEAILKRAKAEIEREKEAAVDALRGEAVDLALAAASKLLKEKLDGDQDRKLVMDFVDGLSAQSPGADA